MSTYANPRRRHRVALAAVAAVACLALLSSVLLLFDPAPGVPWAGLEARQRQPDPPCPLIGQLPERCVVNLASRAVAASGTGTPGAAS